MEYWTMATAQANAEIMRGGCPTLNAGHEQVILAKEEADNEVAAIDCRNLSENSDTNGVLQSNASHNLNSNNVMRKGNKVRRLTPLECERLQAMPDGWTLIGKPRLVEVKDYVTAYVPTEGCPYETVDEAACAYYVAGAGPEIYYDPIKMGFKEERVFVGTRKEMQYFYTDENGKEHRCSDSNRYKAIGNAIALPFWFWLLRRISAQYERPATLGSLFDGVSCFPLCWENCNGPGTALWSSEIDDYPTAVSKWHFPDNEESEANE